MRRLSRPLRWLERGEFFGRCAALERQGETLVVVPGLPGPQGCRSHLEVLEAVPAPKLLVIDPVAPLDFAVLLRAPELREEGEAQALVQPPVKPQHAEAGTIVWRGSRLRVRRSRGNPKSRNTR
jgi:hypothetical protein